VSDFRQCVRCGRMDAVPGTALDSAHKCPHDLNCAVYGCKQCKARRDAEASLPGARDAFIRPGCGVITAESGIANGAAMVERRKA